MFRKLMKCLITFLCCVLASRAFAQREQTSGPPTTFVVLVDRSGSMNDPFPAPVQPRLTDRSKLQDVHRRLALLVDHLPAETRVIVRSFDHQVEPLFEGSIKTQADRNHLRGVFNSIRSRGGSTFLWRTLDASLAQAKSEAESEPGRRIRVLLYSDGKDEEKLPGLDHQSILDKYGTWLRSSVKLDWITIGFDVQGPVRKALTKAGVVITEADTPDDLAPVWAKFKLSKSSVRVGESVKVIDTSYGSSISERWIDWGDGSPFEQTSGNASHVYQDAGEFLVRLAIRAPSGQKDRCSRHIAVHLPALKTTKILVDKSELTVGDRLLAEDKTESPAKSRKWLLNEKLVSSDQSIQTELTKPGEHVLRLERVDQYDRKSSSEALIHVAKPTAPVARLRVANTTSQIGQECIVLNESSTSAIRFEWRVGEKFVSTRRHLKWTPSHAGSFSIVLQVWDAWNQSHSAKADLTVTGFSAPSARIIAADEVAAGDKFRALDASIGKIDSEPSWFLDGQPIGQGKSIEIDASMPGDYVLKNTIIGPGGEAHCEHRFSVLPFPAPVASFLASSARPFVGDVLRITDTTVGPVDNLSYSLIREGEEIARHSMTGEDEVRSFEFPCDELCDLTVRLEVIGPGGRDTAEQSISVLSRAIQPQAEFEMTAAGKRGRKNVVFVNKSTGSVSSIELVAGDGSSRQQFKPQEVISHQYGPGTYHAILTVYCDDPHLLSSTWTSPEIAVSAPWSPWVKHLVWQIPVCVLLAGGAWATAHFWRERRLREELSSLSGSVNLSRAGSPLEVKQFELNPGSIEQTFELDSVTALRFTATDDEAVPARAELLVNGSQLERTDLSELESVQLGEYELSYVH